MESVKTVSASPRLSRVGGVQQRKFDGVRSPNRRKQKTSRRSGSFVFAAALFCSGAAALVYQVLWIKQLSLIVGVEVFSIAIAVSAFFAGLALGGFVIGCWADRLPNPLYLYAMLEAAIAVLGVVSTLLMAHTARHFAIAETHLGVLAWLLPFMLVGVPALFMGGTIPVAVRSRSMGREEIAGTGGAIYAVNTAGGIVGTLCCSLAFIPWFGVFGASLAAASLNLVSASIAYALGRTVRSPQVTSSPAELTGLTREAWLALALYSVAGGFALGYEVVWSQAIVQFLTTRSFAFSIVLATYLAGLALGSALYSQYANKASDHWEVFGALIAAAGLIALAEFTALGIWQLRIQALIGDLVYAVFKDQFAQMCARFIVAAVGIVFLPTLLLGAAFPAALRLIVGEGEVGRDVGRVIALNTAGGIAGTLIAGFVLVPKLGLVKTIGLLAVIAAAIGIVAVFQGSRENKRMRWAVVSIGVAALVCSVATPADRLARLLAMTRGGGTLVSYEESKAGTVAVIEQSSGTNIFRRLYIQGASNSGDAMPSIRYMRLQALLPLIIHRGTPRSALVIGFGTGITAGALLQYPALDRRICAELLPAVVKSGSAFHGNYGASHDRNLQIRIRDGRRELMRSDDRYDVITLEPPPPPSSGVVNLYSRDFYQLAATRLQPEGLFAQWLPIATQNDEDTRSLVRSFLDVFPSATLWTTELHEMLLIGSLTPIELDADRIAQRFNQPSVIAALSEVGVASPAALLATWVTGREGLELYADGVRPVTDDHPLIEYSAWVRPNEITRVLPKLLELKSSPRLTHGSSVLSQEIDAERSGLMAFYDAGLDAYKGDREAWRTDIGTVLLQHRDNPYYQWTIGQR